MRLAFLLLLACAVGASAADLSGKWLGTWEGTTARGPVTESHFLDLQQKGSAITGTTGQEKGPLKWDVRNAKFESGKLTFDGATGDLQLGYDLQLTGDELVGTVVAKNRPGITWKMRVRKQ